MQRFRYLNDDEIVATVSGLHDEPDEKEEEEFNDDEMLENVCPSHEKGYQCLEVALQWIEMQEECDSKNAVCKVSVIYPPTRGEQR
ncbi:hypothetical protein M514_13925 [Trichuris suis]|uniref:Uncharacterized protein n=1 Tax=Trichuris suis TaxID=68888 RepID=A0A085LJQ3_9BILA|nr:hypothetical protein M513_13925 [Trichuris suis]KFD63961.1 hypothetical protein M514_13925 [Trichuris suis]